MYINTIFSNFSTHHYKINFEFIHEQSVADEHFSNIATKSLSNEGTLLIRVTPDVGHMTYASYGIFDASDCPL